MWAEVKVVAIGAGERRMRRHAEGIARVERDDHHDEERRQQEDVHESHHERERRAAFHAVLPRAVRLRISVNSTEASLRLAIW